MTAHLNRSTPGRAHLSLSVGRAVLGPGTSALALAAAISLTVPAHAEPTVNCNWHALAADSAPDGAVLTFAEFDDGSIGGRDLYLGGTFHFLGEQSADLVARWDGFSLQPLPLDLAGEASASVRAMIVFNDGQGPLESLFVAGEFTRAGGIEARNIARFDGQAWSSLGLGFDGPINALAVYDAGDGAGPALYAAGEFLHIGELEAKYIARYSGGEWSAVGEGLNKPVHALTTLTDESGVSQLIAGGEFTRSGGVEMRGVAVWGGKAWASLGAGFNDQVRALATVSDGLGGQLLFAGGRFTLVGQIDALRIAMWNGAEWLPLGEGLIGRTGEDATVMSIHAWNDAAEPSGYRLVAGGDFRGADGQAATRIAQWNGEVWSPLGNGLTGEDGDAVRAVILHDDFTGAGPSVYVGGDFAAADAQPAPNLARYTCGLAGDINQSGGVDIDDLFFVLEAWGVCPDVAECPADLDQNSIVDIDDLFIVLGNM